ncbi:MAG: nucleotide pyrophosphohydrolase [Acidimicrobiaceae bacterium]|nr:nucleotide pyrophosphohydrolase [Acidimicrobiaceae bacterium]
MNLNKINEEIIKFSEERNWSKFHTPKNLSMALSVEASELLEIFQWQKQSDYKTLKKEMKENIEDEVSDIFYYLLRICQKLNIDIEKAFIKKMEKNRKKYPVEKFMGKSTSRKR